MTHEMIKMTMTKIWGKQQWWPPPLVMAKSRAGAPANVLALALAQCCIWLSITFGQNIEHLNFICTAMENWTCALGVRAVCTQHTETALFWSKILTFLNFHLSNKCVHKYNLYGIERNLHAMLIWDTTKHCQWKWTLEETFTNLVAMWSEQ